MTETTANRFASHLTTETNLQRAVMDACESISAELEGPPSLVMAFASGWQPEDCELIAPMPLGYPG